MEPVAAADWPSGAAEASVATDVRPDVLAAAGVASVVVAAAEFVVGAAVAAAGIASSSSASCSAAGGDPTEGTAAGEELGAQGQDPRGAAP